MKYTYINKDNYPLIQFELDNNEQLKIETGSMAYKSSGIELVGKRNGSFFGAIAKSVVGGENFFITTAQSHANKQKIGIAPHGIGDIYEIELTGSTNWYLEDGVFLASTGTVSYDVVRQQGLGNALFAGTGGFFILKTTGSGKIFVESFGSIIEVELDGQDDFIIDNDHIIAWEETLSHKIEIASGTFGFKSGEGLVTRLSGKGKVLLQTRQLRSFAQSIIPFIPTQK